VTALRPLAERRGLTPAQIRTAVRFARLAGDAADEPAGRSRR
jgi:hypothetical protein